MDVGSYISRIRYDGEVRPTLEVLRNLQACHLLSVPFENLDILAGRKIVLTPTALFEKIVRKKRGGFCYELNGLFCLLLKEVGFDAQMLMGRVFNAEENTYGPEFDHMLLLVDLDREQWIVDVGFGDFSIHPLRFILDQPLSDKNGQFRFEQYDREYFNVSRYRPGENRFSPEYMFSLRDRSLPDFSAMCLYHQTSPDSHFTRHKICSLATPNGRITLTDNKLIVTEGTTKTERPISNGSEYDAILARQFDIVL